MSTTRYAQSRGQAALSLVLAITIMLATGAGILATNAIQHDPLVQNDVVQYFSYRSLEAGMNAFVSQVNADPNLINCSSSSQPGGQCNPGNYETWIPISQTINAAGVVPQWYMWGNPTPTPGSNLTSAQVPVYGAAGYPGHIDYVQSTINLKAVNGFLTRVWWSNFEATDPALLGNAGKTCQLNWQNGYNGPGQYCQPVYFQGGDQVYGPIYSNDSIYVLNDPTLGAVRTADPNCQFVGNLNPPTPCYNYPTSKVTQSSADQASSSKGHPIEPLPQSDSQLAALAASNVNGGGCTYSGPTTITLDPNDQMTVWSPDTPVGAKNAAGTTCYSGAGKQVQVPNGTYGNGVIYVQTASSCAPGANPFDNYVSSSEPNGPMAQWMPASYSSTGSPYYDWPGATSSPNCEADAFVSDGTGSGSGVSGQLTIAATTDVIVTGNLEYTDCGSGFNSTNTGPCTYNSGGINDALGLVANQYVVVNHPVYPCYAGGYGQPGDYNNEAYCTPVGYWTNYGQGGYGYGSYSYDVSLPYCSNSQLGTPAAALCDPGPNVTVDAAILALNHSFVVSNWYVCDVYSCASGNGQSETTLKVYGSIDQNYRGPVGVNYGSFTTGYTKYYSWDYRLSYISPPYYLSPGTPSWAIVSSSTSFNTATPMCGANPCPQPTP